MSNSYIGNLKLMSATMTAAAVCAVLLLSSSLLPALATTSGTSTKSNYAYASDGQYQIEITPDAVPYSNSPIAHFALGLTTYTVTVTPLNSATGNSLVAIVLGWGSHTEYPISGNSITFTVDASVQEGNPCNTAPVIIKESGAPNGSGDLVAILEAGEGGICDSTPGCPDCPPPPCTDCPPPPADLVVSKTAAPSFDRTYHWQITKNVDKTIVRQFGGSATFSYTINVSHDAGTDSNWQVTGSIDVTNPNDFNVTGVDVTDSVDNGGTCIVTGSPVDVAAHETETLSYTCTYASAPSPLNGTNTATAEWDETAYQTPTGSASGNADFDFATTNPNLIDETVNVTDTVKGSLGTTTVGQANPMTFNYNRTISIPAHDCLSYDNTARFIATDTGANGTSSKTVQVCGPTTTGGLTMGFWQNKNGQDLIKKDVSSGGACNVGTYLRNYAPFQDLSSTASCSTVATYVTNVIKAADASGASMNKMLKGQMLATTLDVYFSTPGLGSNKIGAASPIGGLSIDLTKICKNISTCTIVENTSSAFGGSTSLTVNQILTYAASQSNAGGGTWYGNVKTTQEKAKDTFDAINNQKVFVI